jgi:hypothetical protein
MGSLSRTIGLIASMALLISACGDNSNNDNSGGPGRTATPVVSPSPGPTSTAAAPACPTHVTYIVNGTLGDLDSGWTGAYSDLPEPVGGSLSFALACPGPSLGSCGMCALSGPVASTTTINNHRCVNDSSITCTGDADCPGSTCAFFFGPSIPASAAGFPICFTNRISGPVTGTLSPELGAGTSNLPIIASLFSGITVDRPCPTCSGATLESTGTCSGGARDGMACTVHGVSAAFGNVSFDCPSSPGGNIGNFPVPLDLTTGTREVQPSATCTRSGGGACWCPGQLQPNACDDGVCTVDASGEGTCTTGPTDQLCKLETFRTCDTNADCTLAGDSCQVKLRDCLGATDQNGAPSAPISRTGTPSQATPLQVSAFCLGATSSSAVNSAAGLPGPGALRLPSIVCIADTCPSAPPTAP